MGWFSSSDEPPPQPAGQVFTPDGKIYVFFGNRRTGKSTLCRKLALQEGGSPASLVIYVTPNSAGTDPFPGEERTIQTLYREPVPRSIVLRGGSTEHYDAAAQFAIDVSKRWRVILIFDECHRAYPQGYSRKGTAAVLFHENRHKGIDLYLVTQWPAFADKVLMRTGDETYWFRLTAAEDMVWISKRWGVPAAAQVANLPDYHYIQVCQDEPPPEWRWVGSQRKDTPE